MRVGLLMGGVLALGAAGCADRYLASASTPWRAVDATTGRLSAVADLEQLAAAFPDSASVQRRLLVAAARADDAALVNRQIARLEAMGFAIRTETLTSLAPLIGAQEAAAAVIRATHLRSPRCASTTIASVPPAHRLVEGVVSDSRTRRLYLASIVDRALLMSGDSGLSAVPAIDAGSLSGLVLDEASRTLWLASGAFDPTPDPDNAFAGLLAFDLDRQAVISRVAAPEGVRTLSDIALGKGGIVYASDPLGGGLYRLAPGANAIETLVAPGTLRSPQGIAVDPSGRRLYVSDYGYGLATVDVASGRVDRIAAASPMMLDGIDGLYWHRGSLIAIQNGTSPMRVVRLRPDRAGTRVEALDVIEAAHPEWGEPTNGHVVGDTLLYIADPQWDRFDAGGKVKGEGPLRPNQVRRVRIALPATPSTCPG